MDNEVGQVFCRYAADKLGQHLAQIKRCLALLNDAEVWQRTNAHANSVGNLLLHLRGNVRQWIVAGLGGVEFERDRPAEFAARGTQPGAVLMAALEETMNEAIDVIRRLEPSRLGEEHTIQGYSVRTMEAVFHVVEHCSGHTGQIVHITKVLKNVDLNLYDRRGQKLVGPPSP